MNRPESRGSARQRLVDAAMALITEQGVHALTLEAVAAAAGVTKGGLIYHFKTRDDLLGAVVAHMVETLDAGSRRAARQHGEQADSRAALLLALVDETFDLSSQEQRLMSQLLAAASAHAHLLAPVQYLFARRYAELGDGPHGDRAVLLAAALDGITLLELLNLHRFDAAQRRALRGLLEAQAQQL